MQFNIFLIKLINIIMRKYCLIFCLFILGIQVSIGQTPYSEELMKKAMKGDAKAQCEIGVAMVYGFGVQKNSKVGFQWIEKSANQNYPDAQYEMGEYYSNHSDYVKSAQWWQKASDNGVLDATYNLAVLYKLGYGVKKDIQKSSQLLMNAAEKGQVNSMFNLSNYYQRGDGVAQNWSKCYYWRKKAADKGSSGACYNLAIDYAVGTPALNQDKNQSIMYINKAVEYGYPMAFLMLGEAYYDGSFYSDGIIDYVKAVTLLNKFLKKSDEMEMENEWMGTAYLILSKCYRFGRGIKKDIPTAERYYDKAKAYGVTDENTDKIIEQLRGF